MPSHSSALSKQPLIWSDVRQHAIAQDVNMARAVTSITLQKNRAQEKSLRNNVNLEDVSYTCQTVIAGCKLYSE